MPDAYDCREHTKLANLIIYLLDLL